MAPRSAHPQRLWSGRNRQLVIDEPVEFEKQTVAIEVEDCRKITDHSRGIYRIYPSLMKENRRMSTCYQLDLQTLGLLCPKISPTTAQRIPPILWRLARSRGAPRGAPTNADSVWFGGALKKTDGSSITLIFISTIDDQAAESWTGHCEVTTGGAAESMEWCVVADYPVARGGHSIVKLNTTCGKKQSTFGKLHHQNGSIFYDVFSLVDIHGIYYIVKNGNQNWGSMFWIKTYRF